VLRRLLCHWIVDTSTVWVSLGWINPGNILIPPTMNLGNLNRICSKGIQNHCIKDSYRSHMCPEYCQNALKNCLGNVFCANNKACHIVRRGSYHYICSIGWKYRYYYRKDYDETSLFCCSHHSSLINLMLMQHVSLHDAIDTFAYTHTESTTRAHTTVHQVVSYCF